MICRSTYQSGSEYLPLYIQIFVSNIKIISLEQKMVLFKNVQQAIAVPIIVVAV